MSLRYSDLHLQILSRGLIEPGEHLTGHVMAERKPWYGFGLLSKLYLLVSTDRRLFLVEHERSWIYRTHVLSKVESVAWPFVHELSLRGLLAKSTLRLVAQTSRGLQKLSLRIPSVLAPVRDNRRAGKAVVASFQAQRALGPASSPQEYVPLTAACATTAS